MASGVRGLGEKDWQMVGSQMRSWDGVAGFQRRGDHRMRPGTGRWGPRSSVNGKRDQAGSRCPCRMGTRGTFGARVSHEESGQVPLPRAAHDSQAHCLPVLDGSSPEAPAHPTPQLPNGSCSRPRGRMSSRNSTLPGFPVLEARKEEGRGATSSGTLARSEKLSSCCPRPRWAQLDRQ